MESHNKIVHKRSGMTLVEQLSVLTAIAIISAILYAVGSKTSIKLGSVLVATDIHQLDLGLEEFAQRFGRYPPDFHDHTAAKKFLKAIFPECLKKNLPDLAVHNPSTALCFWLTGPNGNGFSANPKNPFDDGKVRIGPFCKFKSGRVKVENGVSYYLPPWPSAATPYLYFCPEEHSYKNNDGFTPARPFRDSETNKWVNPETYQILCAGRDGKYGEGHHFPDGRDYTDANMDDLANFSDGSTLGQIKIAVEKKAKATKAKP